jgi:uncharacterized Tic20 family protein
MRPPIFIDPSERTMAALTHLSGLAGYLIPLGGAIVPIIIMMVKSDSPVISSIAKQALLLNFVAFLIGAPIIIMMVTVILIPVAIVVSIIAGLMVITLPVVGAIKAHDGVYYVYPLVGSDPR